MKHLILLHGAIGSSAQLQSLKEKLSGNYQVHTLDFPGHGNAAMIQTFSIESFADHLKEYLVQNKIEKANIFGYSMGGYVALYLAKHHPEMIEKIITLATKFHWDEAIAAKETKMLQPGIIEQKLPDFTRTLFQRHQPNDWKEVLYKTASMLTQMGKDNPLKLEDYSSINIPSLIMLGDRDKMVSLEETVAVYKQLPNAQLAILPNTPHPVEAADEEVLCFYLNRFFI
jgi:pimeloyl-ACP methyl ester carboxylesterase